MNNSPVTALYRGNTVSTRSRQAADKIRAAGGQLHVLFHLGNNQVAFSRYRGFSRLHQIQTMANLEDLKYVLGKLTLNESLAKEVLLADQPSTKIDLRAFPAIRERLKKALHDRRAKITEEINKRAKLQTFDYNQILSPYGCNLADKELTNPAGVMLANLHAFSDEFKAEHPNLFAPSGNQLNGSLGVSDLAHYYPKTPGCFVCDQPSSKQAVNYAITTLTSAVPDGQKIERALIRQPGVLVAPGSVTIVACGQHKGNLHNLYGLILRKGIYPEALLISREG